MILLEAGDINSIIHKVGLQNFYLRLMNNLTEDFKNWHLFQKCSRNAMYVDDGVIELMPICNDVLYSFKYVNGHPLNPLRGKLNVVAFGMLAEVASGYPLMLASMNILTAIRTAAVSALSSKYLAKKDSKKIAIIGCGAQSEFQILAHAAIFPITEVRCYDIRISAQNKFINNLADSGFKIVKATSAQDAIKDVDIIITATSVKGKHKVLSLDMISPGQHICGIGGDSPGKTELDPEILKHAQVVVEYFPQTSEEGEIQNLNLSSADYVHAELWEIISGIKNGRTNSNQITVFDSVGFALEDFSTLKLCYDFAAQYKIGKNIDFVPEKITDSNDLYGLLIRDKNEEKFITSR